MACYLTAGKGLHDKKLRLRLHGIALAAPISDSGAIDEDDDMLTDGVLIVEHIAAQFGVEFKDGLQALADIIPLHLALGCLRLIGEVGSEFDRWHGGAFRRSELL